MRLRALGVVLTVIILQCFAMGMGSSPHLLAQESTPTPAPGPITAITLFDTQFDGPPPGPVTASVATIELKPGQATLPLAGNGSLLILVESGSVTLQIDHAIDGLSTTTSDDTGKPGFTYRLGPGQRVTIPAIGSLQFRNDGDEPSRLLLLSLVPEGDPSLPKALAGS